jgi:hypothetical protein
VANVCCSINSQLNSDISKLMAQPLPDWVILILMFHPVWLTAFVALLSGWLVIRLKSWRKHKRILLAIVAIAVALYVFDAMNALPRLEYARRILDRAVTNRKVLLPATLVLVNADCRKECHARLLSGQLKDVILVETRPGFYSTAQPTRRYRAGWSLPDDCPAERMRAVHWSVASLIKEGFCPVVEPVDLPTEGVFIVQEGFRVLADKKAAPFDPSPKYLTDTPPGTIISFEGVEVQLRTQGHVEVIAARRRYEAPGLIGLPPLIGCWERPDNIIWIMPAGDTGCGLWRWFTVGGDQNWVDDDVEWVYREVFT